jgi:hypothetical protein
MEITRLTTAIPYEDFWSRFIATNKPCVLDATFTSDWPARSDWIVDDFQPKFDYLRSKFGDCVVPVADCSSKYYDSHEKAEMRFGDYVDAVWPSCEHVRVHCIFFPFPFLFLFVLLVRVCLDFADRQL